MVSVRARNGLLGAVLITLFATGCAVNGPNAAPPETTPPSETATESSRPAELDLAGKTDSDMCALLTPEQQGQLRIHDGEPVPKDKPDEPSGCVWNESSNMLFTMSVRAIPRNIADVVGEGSSETQKSYAVAGGFPAEQRQVPGAESLGCSVHVDVAESWTLLVNFSTPPEDMPNQQMCGTAKQAAELAVTTLQGQG